MARATKTTFKGAVIIDLINEMRSAIGYGHANVVYGARRFWMYPSEQSQIAFGDADEVLLSMYCEPLSEADRKEKRHYSSRYSDTIICIPVDKYNSNKKLRAAADKCVGAGVPVIFDERSEDRLVTKTVDGRLHWHGEMDRRFAMSIAKTMFNQSVNSVWKDSFIVSSRSRSKLPQGLCVTLANLLMLGGDEVQLPTKSGSGSAFKGDIAEVINRTVFNTADLDDDAKAILDSVQLFRDYAALWNKAMDDYRFAIKMEESDLIDGVDRMRKTVKSAAEVVNMPDYIETWKMGVSVADIVA